MGKGWNVAMCGFDGSKRVDLKGIGGPLDHGGVVPSARKDLDGLILDELAFIRKAKVGFTRLRTYSFADAPSHRDREGRHQSANFCVETLAVPVPLVLDRPYQLIENVESACVYCLPETGAQCRGVSVTGCIQRSSIWRRLA